MPDTLNSNVAKTDTKQAYKGVLPRAIQETPFVPDAYKHQDAFLRKLLSISTTDDYHKALAGILQVLLEDEELHISYATLFSWHEQRKEMHLLQSNIDKQFLSAISQHINTIHKGITVANHAAYANDKPALLTYPQAKERGIRCELYIPLYSGDTLIGAVYLESCDSNFSNMLDMQFFELIFMNLGLVLHNIQLIRKIVRQANTDGLTGLFNRKYMNVVFGELDASDEPYTIFMLDIDHFKEINDTYGHAVGDDALQSVAAVLMSNLRRNVDIAFRYGGEEFLLVYKGISHDVAVERANHILNSVRDLHVYYDECNSITFTISCGICESVLNVPASKIAANADNALYKAKHSGRNCVQFYCD